RGNGLHRRTYRVLCGVYAELCLALGGVRTFPTDHDRGDVLTLGNAHIHSGRIGGEVRGAFAVALCGGIPEAHKAPLGGTRWKNVIVVGHGVSLACEADNVCDG